MQKADQVSTFPRSQRLFERAQSVIPGGVNSPVRAFKAVGGTPLFIKAASGAFLYDEDGGRYIDYVGSWGPMILGHARAEIIAAVRKAAESGTSFGAPTKLEIELAEEVIEAFPSIRKLRLTSSGTEATMSALRLARGFTGRPKIVKFEGCYHGHGDSLLVRAGSGVATLGLPDSPGVLPELALATITVPFNDSQALTEVFDTIGSEIAAVIIEPVAGNMGCVAPVSGFLEHVRSLTREHNALLIFDEVMTGFRIARGGAQEYYSIEPDLTCLGKIIGGGLPVGAFGGKDDVMDRLAPVGPVYQAGTLSGNPLAVTAGLTALRLIKELNIYELLAERTESLVTRITAEAQKLGIETRANRVGSMFTLFFTSQDVRDWTTASKANRDLYARYFHAMLAEGIYLPPSQFEACFVSTAHSDDLIDATVGAAARALARLQ